MKLYHVSTTPNLKILQPHLSSHGKPYVYATSNLDFALFFGGKNSDGDFDGITGIKQGVPYFFEAYEGALKKRFEGSKCYIYEVEASSFSRATSFRGEVVSEKPVKVLNCEEINDLYQYLLQQNANGKLELHFFENSKEYKEMINNHISDRIIRYGILNKKNSNIYKFCEIHFPDVLENLNKSHCK